MNRAFIEMAEFAGRACGTVAKDLAEFSQPLAEGFRRGWREAMKEKPKTEPAAEQAPNSA